MNKMSRLLYRRAISLGNSFGGSARKATFATEAQWPSKIPMSRFEQDQYINYDHLDKNINTVRERLQRPLTYAEKLLYSHLDSPETAEIEKGSSYLKLRPSRVALQDVSGQMALLQFMTAGLDRVAVPTTVHCDHLVTASKGNDLDLSQSEKDNQEIYNFLRDVCQKYKAGFWKTGAGIIHQVVLENYAYPGGLMIGTDSHTPNAGGLGMAAIGVGGADAVDAMAGLAWEIKAPKIIGVRLTGEISPWTSAKDVILKVASQLTVKGGTGCIIEYFGPGVKSLSCTGMATICNMGAETGATTSVFPYTNAMGDYLASTRRGYIRDRVLPRLENLQADEGATYDQVIELDLSKLEPRINGPATPDLSTETSKFKDFCESSSFPKKLSAGLIGSCTNSSFEDMTRVASLAKQALDAGLKPQIPLLISVGSEQSRKTLEKIGVLDILEKAGATMLASACGPCSGSWARDDKEKNEPNSIITSYNRNFTGRNDGSRATHSFIASPEMVIAKSFAGDLRFDPVKDTLNTPTGEVFSFRPPNGSSLPMQYEDADSAYTPPPSSGRIPDVKISPKSNRLQRLKPFSRWNGQDYIELPILIKCKGKCTTDHISAGGPWFQYRGHLENISNNTLIGAVNAENDQANSVRNVFTNKFDGVAEVAKDYKQRNQQWVIIGDSNYGEGSSREHAALQPRFLNGVAVIARSLARIHETNLKKQGMLPLTFANEADYDRISPSDRISLIGLHELGPGRQVMMVVRGEAGEWICKLNHTINEEQVEYFRHGSALNYMGAQASSDSQPSLATI